MPETGGLAGQSAYIQAYIMAAADLRKALESIEKERYQRDRRYMDQTKDTLLVGPSLSSLDFGFFGDRHPLSSRQMTSAKKFFAHLDTLRATMLRGIGDPDLKSKQPALWLDMVQTLGQTDTFAQSLLVQLHGHGGTERSHIPVVVRSDVYSSIMDLEPMRESLKQEARRAEELSVGAAGGKESMWKRIKGSLGTRSKQQANVPYPVGAPPI